MSNAASLSINWSTPIEIQNTSDIIGVVIGDFQKDNTLLSPLSIAKYALYYRAIGRTNNFGWDNGNYLSYEGGFITCGNKVNTKYSDFSIKQNLFVSGISYFNEGFNVIDTNKSRTNTINNLKSLNLQQFLSQEFDNYIVSKKDYIRHTRFKGMITLWSGTYQDLVDKMPQWRLCAPPDAGRSENGITIPDLQGKFIMGATYQEYGAFQPKDNLGVNFGSPISIDNAESIGGFYDHLLSIGELPRHRHNNQITVQNGVSRIWSTDIGSTSPEYPAEFATAPGTITVTKTTSHSAGSWNTVKSIWRNDFDYTSFGVTTTDLKITELRQDPRGGNENYGVFPQDQNIEYNSVHSNMPPFYALAYIIYVETPRG